MPNDKTDNRGFSTSNADQERDLGAKGGAAIGAGRADDKHGISAPYDADLQTQIAAKSGDLIAKAHVTINAPVAEVWDALVNPAMIQQYMFGANTVCDWEEGSKITWSGEWQGKTYEDKGQILKLQPEKLLQYTHYSSLTGKPDAPENYHTVSIELKPIGNQTILNLSQDNNPTNQTKEHSEENWMMMLEGMKKLLEDNRYEQQTVPDNLLDVRR